MSDLASTRIDRRRVLLGIGGTALASATLAACGGNTGRQSSSTTTGGEGKPAIAQWYHQYGEAGTQQAVERYAKAYPAAKVTVTWKPGDYDQSTAASLLTNSGPDVFEYGNGPTIDMIKGNQVVDLTDLFGDARSDFNDAILKRFTYQDKIWAIPQVIDMQLLVYRKSMLDKAGVQPPETIDDLVSAAKELTGSKVKGLFLGNDGGAGLMGGPMLWSAGLDYLTDDNTFGFDDPKAAQAFTVLRTLFTSKDLLLGAPADWFDPSALTQGLTAMQFTGLWTFPDITKGLSDDFGCVPWPAMDGGAKSVPVGAYGSCVSARAKDVNASKAFAKWLWIDQTDDQLDFATAYGFHIPSRKSLLSKAKTLQSGPAKDAAQYAVDNGHAQTPLLWTPKCQTAFTDMMTKIVKDGADPEKQIAACQTVADAELKRVTA
ncbi:Extracellular solute-binding protein family 1 [Nostocoides japonicum T1-X7]|uniref:Extracellular solute-binding protein family 1 n=1 Tax=Nostocoides japonicum T1-X7 TaxID=1194083 RepID=A0A077M0A5_9MICO|nr:sugar ABC transporter substrate-binding protein [Tetrasphaera japonica]CCH77649.1 Extracellular solute-binding protein family 1 [Tetrasphaera japonica T1-X7]